MQELLDALAQKVALELVSNSKLAEILSGYIATSSINNTGLVTNEGFVADARQMNPNVAGSLAAKVKKNTDDIVTANSNLEWKLNGTYKATDTCPLPEKYNELMIKIYRTSDYAYTCGVNILKAEIGKNTGNWMTGCGRDATGWDVKIVIAITNTIAINSVFINAADNKSAFSFVVYYR